MGVRNAGTIRRSKPALPTLAAGSKWAVAALLLWAASLPAARVRAAELRLRASCECCGPLVTLGDVAQIVTDDAQPAQALAAVELFATPAPGRQQYVGVRELRDLLLLRGVNLAEHRFSGANRIEISAARDKGTPAPEPPPSSSAVQQAKQRVRDAVVQYLSQYASPHTPWTVQPKLSPALSRLVAEPIHGLSVAGGAAPWTGAQSFQLTVDMPQGPVHCSVEADVSVPPAVVHTVRAVPRGAIVHASDVELRPAAGTVGRRGGEPGGFLAVEEVVGQETTRAIGPGKMVLPEELRAPLLVRRNEVVTVYVRCPGICVRTEARSRDDGSLGELVAVESLLDRRRYLARVSELRQVEIYARSPRAEP